MSKVKFQRGMMMKAYILSIYISFLFIGCGSYNDKKASEPTFTGAIVDKASWYSDMEDDVLEMNVLIPVPNDYNCVPYNDLTAPSRPCTLEDIIGDVHSRDDYRPVLHVQMSTKDFVVANDVMNAELAQRGQTTRGARQKSFRVRLDSRTDLYRGERTFQLNKHAFDNSRVKNMLAFSLFREIPNLPSLKTRFVDLKLNGVSYGLFTHVENIGREYLVNRGWHRDENLYKAQRFVFEYRSELALDSNGVPLDLDAFDSIIEIERGDNHKALISMLHAINDARTDAKFEEVFAKYFNRDNYMTWLAVNIITANKDTVTQNFYLLNPMYSNTFYFLPWDYDGAGRADDRYAKWELGIGTWWGVPLHRKFLKIQKNRDDLDAMVTKLYTRYMSVQKVTEKINTYRPLIEPLITAMPDSRNLSFSRWQEAFEASSDDILRNIQNYKDELGSPMSFWQWFTYDRATSRLTLTWQASHDFEGDSIVYDIKCADNYDMNNSIIDIQNAVVGTELTTASDEVSYTRIVAPLSSGQHLFMQVIAKEENNASSYQVAFEKSVRDADGDTRFGVLEFIIE